MSRLPCPTSFALTLLLLVPVTLAGDPAPDPAGWFSLQSGPADAAARLDEVEAIPDGLGLSLVVPGLQVRALETPGGTRGVLDIPGGAVSSKPGDPRLPVLRYLVETPPGARVTVELLVGSPRTHALAELGLGARLLAVQPPVPKLEGAAARVPFVEDAGIYATNAFLPQQPAVVVDRAVIRGRHVALVEVRPVRYNPAAGRIETWSRAELRVRFEGGVPEMGRRDKGRLASRWHDAWLDREIVALPDTSGPRSAGQAGGAANGAVGMLVVAHDSLADAVQPLIEWKRKTGYKVELIRTSDLGSSPTDADVKAAVQQRYDTWSDPALDYLLMVGDTDFTPIHWGNGGGNSQVTDNWYACLDGTDYLPEIDVARISTRSAAETADVVDKLLTYERATFAGDEWIKKMGFVGTNDSGYISMIEDTHDWCIDSFYTPNGYQPTDWSHGGASCDRHYNSYGATTADLSDSIDDGRSIFNYSGHGGTGGWEGPTPYGSYDQADVRANTNNGMYPFVISNACVTGTLNATECFGETWQKEPGAGAIAFWGASNNSYWGEDDVLQRNLHDNIFPMDDTPPIGLIVNATKLDLYTHYGATGSVAYYYDMYNLLSEPSLSLWTRAPRTLQVNHASATPIGDAAFDVTVLYQGQPVEGALVALRKQDDGVFEAGYTDAAGLLALSLDPAPQTVGTLELTVTGHDWRPHEATVEVVSPDSPWLIHRSHGIDDSAGGDGDGTANPGEVLIVPVSLENVGGQPGEGLQATLTTTTPGWCTVLDGHALFPDLAPQQQGQSLPDHYSVAVSSTVPDGTVLGFDLAWSASDGSSGTTSFQETVRAVDFALDQFAVDDVVGNGNGVAGPGETVEMSLTVTNVGHHGASGVSGTLSSASPHITFIRDTATYPDLGQGASGASQPPPYRFVVASDAPDQQPVTLELTLTDGASGYTELIPFEVPISSCTTYGSTDVPLQIDDESTAISELDFLEATTVTEANVFVDISHTAVGNLQITLRSPSDDAVVLHAHSGGSADNLVTWYDEQTAPAEPLSAFNGDNSFGSWRLEVSDNAFGDIGTVNAWAVEICGPPMPPLAQLAADGFTVDDGASCDPDLLADVGETVIYNVTVRNAAWADTTGVSATLDSADAVAVLNNPIALPDLAVGESAVAPFEVLIGAVECLAPVTFTIDMQANEGAWNDSLVDTVEADLFETTELEDVEHSGAEPAGWSHVADRGTDDWSAVSTRNHSTDGSWSWFASNVISMKDDSLISPPLPIAGTATLEFWHWVDLELDKDGGVLEISDNGLDWTDLGPHIVTGGYNGTMTGNSLIAGREAWTGTYLTWRHAVVDLSPWAGSTVQLRWRLTCNLLGSRIGWWVDDILLHTRDVQCDVHACGIPGEVQELSVNRDGNDALLEWSGDPVCVEFGVWRSTDLLGAGSFSDVTTEDPDPTDLSFRDVTPGSLVYWIIEGRGPDGDGPWGHFGQ